MTRRSAVLIVVSMIRVGTVSKCRGRRSVGRSVGFVQGSLDLRPFKRGVVDKVVVVDKSSPLCREPLRCASPLFASTCARVGLSSHLSRVRKCAGAAMMGAAALTRTRALSDRLWRGDRLQHRNTCAEVSAACLPRARAPLLCRSPRSRPACRARRALRHPVTCASTACSPGVHSAAADSLPANHGTGDGARAADGLDRLRHPLTLRL